MNPFKMLKSMFGPAPRFTPGECGAKVRSGAALLIDVREPEEWAAGVAQQAVLLPLSDLAGHRAKWEPFLAALNGREMFLYCGAGVRSAMATRVLIREGHRAANSGSFDEWRASGWPVVAKAQAK